MNGLEQIMDKWTGDDHDEELDFNIGMIRSTLNSNRNKMKQDWISFFKIRKIDCDKTSVRSHITQSEHYIVSVIP